MAQKVQVILEDDLDGSPAEDTVVFGLDGAEYEIDLSGKNAAALRDALAPYVASARRIGGRRRRGVAEPARPHTSDATAIRSWALENGYQVSSRGRVSAEIREAYEKATKSRKR